MKRMRLLSGFWPVVSRLSGDAGRRRSASSSGAGCATGHADRGTPGADLASRGAWAPDRLQLGRSAHPLRQLLPLPRTRRKESPGRPAPRHGRGRVCGAAPPGHVRGCSRQAGREPDDLPHHARERRRADAAAGHEQGADAAAGRDPAGVDRAGRGVQAALGVYAAPAGGGAGGARGPVDPQRHRPVRAGAARSRRAEALGAGGQGDPDQPRDADADGSAPDAWRRWTRSWRTRLRRRTRSSSIGCSPRLPTASTWAGSGSTSRGMRRATASWTTRTTACSGRIATG